MFSFTTVSSYFSRNYNLTINNLSLVHRSNIQNEQIDSDAHLFI